MASLKNRLAAAASEERTEGKVLLKEGDERFARVPVQYIEPDPDQPRKSLGNIDELKNSILEHGIIQPIVISPFAEESFRIIAGERRFTAAKELGLETVPAIIRTIDEHRRLEVQIIENIHRQELSPVEEAAAYQRLINEFQLSQRQLASRVGRSAATINETLRILSMPEDLLASVRTSERVSRSVLLEIAKEEDPDVQRKFVKQALSGGLTVKTLRSPRSSDVVIQPSSTASIKLSQATITIRFHAAEHSQESVKKALEDALLSLGE